MGSSNQKGKLVKLMTSKQMERVSIIEERHHLCKELTIQTGTEITRRPVPDWRWNGDADAHSNSKTADNSKSINDDVEGHQAKGKQRKKPEGKNERSSTAQKKKGDKPSTTRTIDPIVRFVQSTRKPSLKLEDYSNLLAVDRTKGKTQSTQLNKQESFPKNSTLTKVKTTSSNNNNELLLSKIPEKPQKNKREKLTKGKTHVKVIKKYSQKQRPLINQAYMMLMAKIRKNILEGKQLKSNKKGNGSFIQAKGNGLDIGQPADSDYEYEY